MVPLTVRQYLFVSLSRYAIYCYVPFVIVCVFFPSLITSFMMFLSGCVSLYIQREDINEIYSSFQLVAPITTL